MLMVCVCVCVCVRVRTHPCKRIQHITSIAGVTASLPFASRFWSGFSCLCIVLLPCLPFQLIFSSVHCTNPGPRLVVAIKKTFLCRSWFLLHSVIIFWRVFIYDQHAMGEMTCWPFAFGVYSTVAVKPKGYILSCFHSLTCHVYKSCMHN